MVLDHPLISRRYFFPRGGAPAEPFWVDCGEAQLACSYIVRDPQAKTLIHFHGNGEIVSDYLPDFQEALLQLGVNVFLAEYRGYGGSTGAPSLVKMLDDTSAIFDAIGLPQEQLVIFGRSVGSIYALEFADRYPDIAGLVIESGIADPLSRIIFRVDPDELGVSEAQMAEEAAEYLDHQKKLERLRAPLLILHTEHDHIVDKDHAERNIAWAGCADKTLHLFPRGDHNTIMFLNGPEYMEQLRGFLGRL